MQTGCFFKIKSDDVQFSRSVVSNTSDMAYYSDDSGKLTAKPWAFKLEYTLEKYLTDYKCTSDIKRFRHAGTFPVYYYTPDNSMYMTTVIVTDRKLTLI